MAFARRLAAATVVVVGSVAFLVVLVMALLSLSRASGTRIESDEANSSAAVDATVPDPAGPETSPVVPFDGSGGNISCYRGASGATAGLFLVQVFSPGATPQDLSVAVDLVTSSGERQPRAIGVSIDGLAETTTAPIPDSNTDGPFTSCLVTAFQRGQRVTFTGN